MVINQASIKTLFQGFRTVFVQAFQGAKPQWQQIAMRTTSTAASEIYNWLGAVPGMKKLVGEVVIENLAANKFTIVNDEYESTVAVKERDIKRDNYGIYNPLVQSMGLAAAQHPDELVGSLLSNGFTDKDYTGKAFFADNKEHEPGNKETTKFSNKGTGALSSTTYSTAKANLKGRKNARGRSMKLGQSLLLIVPPALEDTAREILQAERHANGKTNIQKGTADLLVLPDLESDTAWFLIEQGHPVKPLIVQIEEEPKLTSLTSPDSDHVFKKHEYLYQAYGSYAAGYGLPQLAYGSTGAA